MTETTTNAPTADLTTVGTRVIIGPEVARAKDNGVVYVVKEKLQKNVVIEPENGGRGLRINPEYLRAAPAAGAPVVAEVIAFEPLLSRGTVVRFTPAAAVRLKHDGLLVVTGEQSRAGGYSYRLEYLGGDPRGRYFRGVGRSALDVVPVESINR